MKLRTLLVVCATVALTVGVATATGNDGGKLVKGSFSGSYEENFIVGDLGTTLTGKVKHVGSATLALSVTGPTFKPTTFDSTGTWTLTAANGDQISGTSTGTCTRDGDFVVTRCVLDLVSTAGTGRYTDASATFTATTEITQLSCDPGKPFCHGLISAELVGDLSL